MLQCGLTTHFVGVFRECRNTFPFFMVVSWLGISIQGADLASAMDNSFVNMCNLSITSLLTLIVRD
jgi:hypothetical protein